MNEIDQLASHLIPHYSRFDVGNRLIFTGHSLQAWPDMARKGLVEAYDATAKDIDGKWPIVEEKREILRDYLRYVYDDPHGLYCHSENTHHLLVAWLSSFDLKNKPKIITTNGEFHSMFRQLHRLTEEGLQVAMVDAESDEIVEQISNEIDDTVSAIMMSRVYFRSSLVNQHITEIARLARSKNIPLLIDDYHGTNVVPMSFTDSGLEDCYLITGGYKYLQWGEGNCFLRFPQNCTLRPAITGWFASFSTLDEPRNMQPTNYDDGNQRFASATYDPSSNYRAAKVVEFFKEQNLTPQILHRQYQSQILLIRDLVLEQNIDPSLIKLYHQKPLEQNGGFLSLQSPHAHQIYVQLKKQKVFTDARGDILRFGMAPYITTAQIEQAIKRLAAVVQTFSK